MVSKFRNYVLTGFFIVMPLLVSIGFLWWVFMKLTDVSVSMLPAALRAIPYWKMLVRFVIPIIFILLLAIVGLIARLVFVRKMFGWGEKILIKIPLFNKVYVTVKQLSNTFINREKTVFKKAVLIQYPRKGIYSLGFLTSKAKGEIQVKTCDEMLYVFVPTTPNPTSGILVFVRKDDMIELEMTVEEGIKLVISGGLVTPDYIEKK